MDDLKNAAKKVGIEIGSIHSRAKFIDEYLLTSKRLKFVCQLIDSRHQPMKTDIDMFKWLVENNLPVLVIATKTDKISKMAIQKHLNEIKKALGVDNMDILPYSSAKNVGRAELLDVIGNSLLE